MVYERAGRMGVVCVTALAIVGTLSAKKIGSGIFGIADFARGGRVGKGLSGFGSTPFLADTNPEYAPVQNDQENPAIAFDGEDYLVVWDGYRDVTGQDVFAARVTPQGELLDSASIVVSGAPGLQWYPDVAFDGENYLVVWMDERNGQRDVYGARVSRAGKVLDTLGIKIAGGADEQSSPAVAFGGGNYLVAYNNYNTTSGYDIYGVRVTPQGQVVASSRVAISSAPGNQQFSSVTYGGNEFLVLWRDSRNGPWAIYGARVSTGDTVLDSTGIEVSSSASDEASMAASFDGVSFLAVWGDYHSGSLQDITGARMNPAGKVLDTSGIAIAATADPEYTPSVTFDSTDFLVSWFRNGDIYAQWVTPQGALADTASVLVGDGGAGQAKLLFAGNGFLAVWIDNNGGEYQEVNAARLDLQRQVLNVVTVSTTSAQQENPAVASDGTDYLAVWEDYRRGPDTSDIYAARISPDGMLLNSSSFRVSDSEEAEWEPAVAYNGTEYLVVWADDRNPGGIYATRVTPQGEVVDPGGIPIAVASGDGLYPRVASDGANFLVVWQRSVSGTWHVRAALVDAEGRVEDTSAVPPPLGVEGQYVPGVAFDGRDYVVAWADYGTSGAVARAARVTTVGLLLDSSGVTLSGPTGYIIPVNVAGGSAGCAVVWSACQPHGDYAVYLVCISPEGAVLDSQPVEVAAAPCEEVDPAACFDGTNYFLAWIDSVGSSTAIYGARVTPAGTVAGTGLILRQARNQVSPALTRGPGNHMLLAYQGWTSGFQDRDYNDYRVWGMLDPSLGVCEPVSPQPPRTPLEATIIRGVLTIVGSSQQAGDRSMQLLDISGRKVLGLKPGANDVSRLAPGVYFVSEQSAVSSKQMRTCRVRKVVLTR